MSKLPGNEPLRSSRGHLLGGLRDINALRPDEKAAIYNRIIPPRLFSLLDIAPETHCGRDGRRRVTVIAPEGMNLARIEVRDDPDHSRPVFFLDLTETHFHQMELSFCTICDPQAPYFAVDVDENGKDNCFATLGRNIPEEIRAMHAGLFPHQTRRGLKMFAEFFTLFERFVDGLGMDIIVAEPLTYDNAIRYEKYGFDYLSGRRLMAEIDRQFQVGGRLFNALDGSSPFRMPGMEKTVHGRSWAIYDGIMDEPWDDVRIYKSVGICTGLNSFPDRIG